MAEQNNPLTNNDCSILLTTTVDDYCFLRAECAKVEDLSDESCVVGTCLVGENKE